jgi:hypothetical protein
MLEQHLSLFLADFLGDDDHPRVGLLSGQLR